MLDLLVVVGRDRVLAELVVLLDRHQVRAFGDPGTLILRFEQLIVIVQVLDVLEADAVDLVPIRKPVGA